MKTHPFQYHTGGGEPVGKISIDTTISMNRDLTDDESYMIRQFYEKLVNTIAANTLLADPETQKEMAERKAKMLSCFGEEKIYVKELPDGYGNRVTYPWFLVTTRKGTFKVGWRAHVINLDWSDTDIRITQEAAKLLFFGNINSIITIECGTNSWNKEHYVHAYSYELLTEYITKLLNYEL